MSKLKSLFGSLKELGEEKIDQAREYLFGIHLDENIELSSSNRININKKSNPDLNNVAKVASLSPHKVPVVPEDFEDQEQFADYDCSRNLVVTSTTLFRKGPIPIEDLSHREQNRLSRRGCLLEWNDAERSTSDNHMSFIDPSSKSLLTYFARMGTGEDDDDVVNLAFIESLLSAGADMNYPDVYGQSIFFGVVRDWHVDVARFAIERGANVNHKDQFGRTPLHLAAAVNYAEMVSFLIDNGGDIYSKTAGEEQIPLHFAARYNSVEAMKALIQAGANIDCVDFLERTPLHVAAETGSIEAVKFLMNMGAPTGVYDSFGNSAMAMIIEKVPQHSYEALNQFLVEDSAMRRRYYYLDHLEFDVKSKGQAKDARNVLETIVVYEEVDLMSHPAIRKLLQVKWKLFGRRQAFIKSFWSIMHTALATILTYSIPYDSYDKQFFPIMPGNGHSGHVWKIILGILFFLLTSYFAIKQTLRSRSLKSRDQAYKNHRLKYIDAQMKYCHPRWSEERELLENEIERISKIKSMLWHYWNIFEWVSLIVVLIVFTLHIINVASPDKTVFKTARYLTAITLLLVWIRMYKAVRVARVFSDLNVLLTHIGYETLRFLVVFMDFYIPFAFVFYMMFGGPSDLFGITKGDMHGHGQKLGNFFDVLYYCWLVMFDKKFPNDEATDISESAFKIILGTYIIIVTLLSFMFIGRLSETFSRVFKKATSNADLVQAQVMLSDEKELGINKTRAKRKFMRRFCGPMVVPFETNKEPEDDDQNINIGINHVTAKIEEVTNNLRKAHFPREEKKSMTIKNLSVFESSLEQLLQRQYENERKAGDATKTIKTSQTKTINMIKDTIDGRKIGAKRT